MLTSPRTRLYGPSDGSDPAGEAAPALDGSAGDGPGLEEVTWPGGSGRSYDYWVYPAQTRFFDQRPANYIFARRTADGAWQPLFIGQCSDLSMLLLTGHIQEQSLAEAGATHVHIHLSSLDWGRRLAEEDDLRRRHEPPCNRL